MSITIPGNGPEAEPGETGTVGNVTCFSDHYGHEVPCHTGDGTWSGKWQCWVKPAPYQLPAGTTHDDNGNAILGGPTTDEGKVYYCTWPGGIVVLVFIPDGEAPTIDPGALARQLAVGLNIRAIAIGIVPKPDPTKAGLVGMPVWMWVKDPGPQTIGPIGDSASAGGITVTIQARLDRIEWDMGDGTRVTCHGGGTPYKPAFEDQSSPDCGHRYNKMSDRDGYTVTAESFWTVNWQGGGQSGTITLNPLRNSVQVRVAEMQVLGQ